MRVPLLALLLLPVHLLAQMQEVQVGLLRDQVVRHAIVLIGNGGASLEVDGRKVTQLAPNDGLRLEVSGTSVKAKSLGGEWTGKDRVLIVPRGKGAGFRLRSLDHKMADRQYPGWLQASVRGDQLLLIDQVELEEYVAGVVMSEAGKDQDPEYYKLQAVSCRTYALANLRKHAAEGFELCDGTHCQVFQGAAADPAIQTAAHATHGMVVVDADIRLIHATFHSNCGGETMNAEDVWSKPEPYLRATVDTFCTHGPHALWRRAIGRAEWLDYLHAKFGVDINDSQVVTAVTNHEPACRELYLGGISPLIPIAQVRTDWNLNSAYFSIEPEGDHLLFIGRGFGHGVGLCQEGAMHMAREGIAFTDILHHYYTDVHIVDLSTLDFFRDDDK